MLLSKTFNCLHGPNDLPTDKLLTMKNFALIGVAGYIAPRHLQAIKDSDNRLVAALDKNDSVGILDRFFDNVMFFTEFERFDRYAEKLRRSGGTEKIDYVSICSPNYLHDAHIRFALRIGANAICEKPLVLNPWNLDALKQLEDESGHRIFTILQLRLHPVIIALRNRIAADNSSRRYDVELTYITPRGNWYDVSWKGDESKSGGVATNIGIHFFDMLMWLFGGMKQLQLHYSDRHKSAGFIELERANVRWFLSLDKKDVPESTLTKGGITFRSITIDGVEVDFTEGFTDLHTVVYKDILGGGGFGIEDMRASINLAHQIRNSEPVRSPDYCHSFLTK